MLAELTVACEVLGDALKAADPGVMSGDDCATAVELLARTEKRCAAFRALAAARAAECSAHKSRGYSNPAQWLADTSGVSTGEAQAALNTANSLGACPETKEALLAGEVSLGQAGEIAKTEKVVPGSGLERLGGRLPQGLADARHFEGHRGDGTGVGEP